MCHFLPVYYLGIAFLGRGEGSKYNSKCFSCFGIPELSMYVHYEHFAYQYEYVLCIYVMNILCTFHVFISGNVTEGVSSDDQIVTAKIYLSLCRNTKQTTKTIHYDWPLLNHRDISEKYTLRNKFYALQEISKTLTPNDKYENFINANMETAAECIPTKLRTKYRVPWEIRDKRKTKKCENSISYVIKETQLMPTLRNLRWHQVN